MRHNFAVHFKIYVKNTKYNIYIRYKRNVYEEDFLEDFLVVYSNISLTIHSP